jgi:hypothetical protein
MIGGSDIVIPAVGDAVSLAACLQIVQRFWPRAWFEDAVSGDKYGRYDDIPLGHVHEVLVYTDAAAEAAWDADCPESPPNSMVYLIASPHSVTAVLDDPGTTEMTALLESMKTVLGEDLRNRLTGAKGRSPVSTDRPERAGVSGEPKNQV